TYNYGPKFGINLRSDDLGILKWLREYFDCGVLYNVRRNQVTGNAKPAVVFSVQNLFDILRCVIPHFDSYPLRAKKLKDYITWKKMVVLQAAHFRRREPAGVTEEMCTLYKELRNGRAFDNTIKL